MPIHTRGRPCKCNVCISSLDRQVIGIHTWGLTQERDPTNVMWERDPQNVICVITWPNTCRLTKETNYKCDVCVPDTSGGN